MTLQLLRPEWLLLVFPLLLILWLLWNRTGSGRDWAAVVDPALLPHLLVGNRGRKNRWPLLILLIAGLMAITALAGPVWKKLPLPVFKQQSALVIALDLSSSMNAADIKPSRLTRARLKLKDLLDQRKQGQTALIAYAATPYTVSPLTDDNDTIKSLVSSLTTDIMPAQGSRADLAIQKALELFKNAGLNRGDILLITDQINASSQRNLDSITRDGFRVSILAVGTEEGAPVPARGGGFLKDNKGSIVIAKTSFDDIRAIATTMGGVFSPLSIDERDLDALERLLAQDEFLNDHLKTDFTADRWREEGPWLLLLVVPLAALLFRRGVILSLLLLVLIVPLPRPVMADGWQWNDLWQNRNQRGKQALQQGDLGAAVKLFEQADWKAAALYKSQQYEQALKQLESSRSSESLYNRGNALARLGRLQEALESYEELLNKQPQHEDAAYNRDLVRKALEQQQQQQQQQDKSEQAQNDQQQQDRHSDDQSDSQQSEDDTEQSSSQQQAGDDSESRQQDESDAEQQQDDQKEAEQAQEESEQQDSERQDEQQSQAQSERQLDISEKLTEQAEKQWLRRIPDDPGGLLRNKFKYQYSRQPQAAKEQETW